MAQWDLGEVGDMQSQVGWVKVKDKMSGECEWNVSWGEKVGWSGLWVELGGI